MCNDGIASKAMIMSYSAGAIVLITTMNTSQSPILYRHTNLSLRLPPFLRKMMRLSPERKMRRQLGKESTILPATTMGNLETKSLKMFRLEKATGFDIAI